MTTKSKTPRIAPTAKQTRLPLPSSPAEKKEIDDGIGDLVHAIAGPVIVFPNTGWEDTIPKWVFNEIQLRRLTQSMREHNNAVPDEEKNRALDIECLAYIYPATLAAPMDHDWAQIYCWLVKKCMMERMCGGKQMKADEFKDIAPGQLSIDERREYDGLRRWLWEKNLEQKKEIRKRGREHAREAVVQIQPPQGQMYFNFAKEPSETGIRTP
jgi:hypothetical protein